MMTVTCPNCRQTVQTQPISFSWWGGVLGPKMLSHVQCPLCKAKFNGKTGQSNNTAIAIYMVVTTAIVLVLFAFLLNTL